MIAVLPLSLYAETNVNKEVKKPDFEDSIDLKGASTSQSIIFDNYEEVFIKNFEEQKITEIHFLGNVKIRFQENTLLARKVVVTAKGDKVLEIAAFENVEFHLGGDIYLAKEMMFEPEKQRGVLKEVRSYMGGSSGGVSPLSSSSGWYYTASKATILDKNRVVLDDVVFTTSEHLLPHYSFFAGKLWFFKGQVVYALNLTYTVGQSDFLYFPFFLRWEKGTGIRTALAQEKRIGWYMMNSYDYQAPYGNYSMGLDLYERLGEFAFITFDMGKAMSNITRLHAEVQVADDVRIFNQGNRYTQLLDVTGNGQFSSIRQFSWRYKLNLGFKISDINLSLDWEDNNDPTFISKYQQRRETIDIQKLLQPENNYFYTYSDSSFGTTGGFSRNFSLSTGQFNLSGRWNYERMVAMDTNQYLNERYKYYVKSRSLPNLSYSTPSIPLIKELASRTPKSFSVAVSNTNLIFNTQIEVANYLSNWLKLQKNLSATNKKIVAVNTTNTNKIKADKTQPVQNITNQSKTTVLNTTNSKPIVLPKVTTNYNELYNFNSALSARLNFSSSETLETNGNVLYDKYIHSENGGMSFNGSLFNKLIVLNNSLSFLNQKTWTSLGTNYNDTYNTGAQLSLNSTAAINQSWFAWKSLPGEINVPFNLSHNISWQIYKTLAVSKPREIYHTSSLRTGMNMFQRQLNLDLSLSHTLRYRLTNDINDIYINNKLEQRLNASTSLKAWWFTAGTSLNLDLLETRSNTLVLDYTDLTNRFVGNAHPRLSMGLTVPNNYLTATYLYDLIDHTNVNARINSKLTLRNLAVPLIYELTSLNLDATFYYDFLQRTASIFTLSISLDIRLTKYWKLNFNTSVKNNQLYRYFAKSASELPEGVSVLNFWEDLGDSLKIWDYEALKRGNFKIQGLHFNLSHDLDEWVLNIQFNVNRRIDSVRLVAFWEPAIRIEFMLNGSSDQFPPYEQKFVPPQYQ